MLFVKQISVSSTGKATWPTGDLPARVVTEPEAAGRPTHVCCLTKYADK